MKKITMIKAFALGTVMLFTMQASKAQNNNALNFVPANNTYVNIPTSHNIPVGNSAYTIEAWIYPNSMNSYGIVGWGNYGNYNQTNALRLDASGELINYWWNLDLAANVGDISGAWHHVAATYDGTTRSLYLDGNLVASDNPGVHAVPDSSNFDIGLTNPSGVEFFNGSIDEVSIWSIALTQAQIRANMAKTLCPPVTGLVAYYNFNEGIANGTNTALTTVGDSSGNSNTGILTNFALSGTVSNFVSGVPVANGCKTYSNVGLNFNGYSSFVQTPIILPASYTKEAWIYMTADQGSNNIISGEGNGSDDAFWIPTDVLSAGHNGNWFDVQDPNPIPFNTWTHVAVTYDAATTTMTLYRNGVQVSQDKNEDPILGSDGSLIGSYGYGNFFQGTIDEVRIWDHALTAGEIQSNMNHSLCLPANGLLLYYTFNQGIPYGDNTAIATVSDTSGNGNDGTLNNFAGLGYTSNFVAGVPGLFPTCPPANALNFDGVNDYASTSVISTINDNLTMEAHVSWNGSTSGHQQIVLNGNTGNAGYSIVVDHSNNDSLSVLLGGVVFMQSSAKLAIDTMQMVSVVREQGVWTLYLNGVAYSLSNNTSTPNYVFGAFNVGANENGTENFNGTIDEVRFWNRPLCQNEILSRLTSSPAANTPGLIALYNFNEGSAGTNNAGISTVADSSITGSPSLTLSNFTLNGDTSNFVAATGALSGISATFTPSVPNVTVAGALTFCSGDSVVLTSDSASAYSWNGGVAGTTRSITVTQSGSYQVTIHNTTPGLCYGTDTSVTVQVVVNQSPSAKVIGDVTGNTICLGLSEDLAAQMVLPGSYTFNWSNGSTNLITTVTPTVNTTYSLVVTGSNGCTDTVHAFNVTVNQLPVITITGNNSINIGSVDTLTANPSINYVWTSGSTSDTTMVSPASTTSYTVTGTDGNGCVDTASFVVTVNINTGVKNEVFTGSTSLYPNPSRSTVYLTFNMNSSEDAVVKVIGINGAEISSTHTTISNGMQMPIDVSALAPGNYFIRVITSKNTQVVKFVKE